MEIALNSDTPGGFKHENAIASQNGLALLASITLKNALNINNNNNNTNNNCTKNNITKNNNNNHFNFNQNKINIKNHEAPQLQHGFISLPTIASSSLSSSAITANISVSTSSPAASTAAAMQQINNTEQKNVFTFTTAGLQALTAASVSTIENKSRSKLISVDQQQQGLAQANAASSPSNSKSYIKKKNNHLQTNNNTHSAKDPTVALLEALSIKTKKTKQQTSSTSSTITTTFVATNCNNNTNNSNNISSNTNGSGGNSNSNKNNYRIPSDILDDLASRFIINVPDMELSNLIRICFQIELAHWFYLDFFCASEEEKKLQPCGIKQFALQIFEHIPFLRQHLSTIDKILEDWKNYKLSVPTYGAILISEDLNYCLLVQSYFAKSSWGFPKGKVNENEDPVHCATREVYEETGYDITELIVPNDYIEAVINYQYTRLYIVRDVSLETKFSPRTRNEIKCCDWFPIDSLPVNKNDAISKPKLGRNANSFFMIMPFVKRLKKWVNDKRNNGVADGQHKYSSGGSPTSTSPLTAAIKNNGQQLKSNCKKQKRNNSNNFNDDVNALSNAGGASVAALATTSCGNNANNNNCSNSNSNRSKRQRHKSMGDLDVTKLNNFNNFNNNNNQSNCKSTTNNNHNHNNNNCGSIITSSGTATSNCGGNISSNNINANNSNQKRNSKIVAAGSNVSNANNGCNTNNNNNISNSNNSGNSSSKRQLFHSQSQTNNLQQNGEKIVSSFDLIRKEKQMKAAVIKTQKQQQNLNNFNNNNHNNGRQRAKSQSDRMCLQQQQQHHHQQQQQQQHKTSSNIGKQQQRLQKQQSLNTNNTNLQIYNISNNNHHHINNNSSNKNHITNHNINTKFDINDSFNNTKLTIGTFKTPTPPPISGNDLLALAAAAAAAPSSAVHSAIKTSPKVSKKSICVQQEQQLSELPKPRPSSVSLHFPEVSPFKYESANTGNQMPQLTRMASGTNLRILKRSTSHQSAQQQPPQPPQRQASALQFTPSFNSWTNFTFTKNLIANVFC